MKLSVLAGLAALARWARAWKKAKKPRASTKRPR